MNDPYSKLEQVTAFYLQGIENKTDLQSEPQILSDYYNIQQCLRSLNDEKIKIYSLLGQKKEVQLQISQILREEFLFQQSQLKGELQIILCYNCDLLFIVFLIPIIVDEQLSICNRLMKIYLDLSQMVNFYIGLKKSYFDISQPQIENDICKTIPFQSNVICKLHQQKVVQSQDFQYQFLIYSTKLLDDFDLNETEDKTYKLIQIIVEKIFKQESFNLDEVLQTSTLPIDFLELFEINWQEIESNIQFEISLIEQQILKNCKISKEKYIQIIQDDLQNLMQQYVSGDHQQQQSMIKKDKQEQSQIIETFDNIQIKILLDLISNRLIQITKEQSNKFLNIFLKHLHIQESKSLYIQQVNLQLKDSISFNSENDIIKMSKQNFEDQNIVIIFYFVSHQTQAQIFIVQSPKGFYVSTIYKKQSQVQKYIPLFSQPIFYFVEQLTKSNIMGSLYIFNCPNQYCQKINFNKQGQIVNLQAYLFEKEFLPIKNCYFNSKIDEFVFQDYNLKQYCWNERKQQFKLYDQHKSDIDNLLTKDIIFQKEQEYLKIFSNSFGTIFSIKINKETQFFIDEFKNLYLFQNFDKQIYNQVDSCLYIKIDDLILSNIYLGPIKVLQNVILEYNQKILWDNQIIQLVTSANLKQIIEETSQSKLQQIVQAKKFQLLYQDIQDFPLPKELELHNIEQFKQLFYSRIPLIVKINNTNDILNLQKNEELLKYLMAQMEYTEQQSVTYVGIIGNNLESVKYIMEEGFDIRQINFSDNNLIQVVLTKLNDEFILLFQLNEDLILYYDGFLLKMEILLKICSQIFIVNTKKPEEYYIDLFNSLKINENDQQPNQIIEPKQIVFLDIQQVNLHLTKDSISVIFQVKINDDTTIRESMQQNKIDCISSIKIIRQQIKQLLVSNLIKFENNHQPKEWLLHNQQIINQNKKQILTFQLKQISTNVRRLVTQYKSSQRIQLSHETQTNLFKNIQILQQEIDQIANISKQQKINLFQYKNQFEKIKCDIKRIKCILDKQNVYQDSLLFQDVINSAQLSIYCEQQTFKSLDEKINFLLQKLHNLHKQVNLQYTNKQYQINKIQQEYLNLLIENKRYKVIDIQHIKQNIEINNFELMLYVLKESLLQSQQRNLIYLEKSYPGAINSIIGAYGSDQYCYSFRTEQIKYEVFMENEELRLNYIRNFKTQMSKIFNIKLEDINILGFREGSLITDFQTIKDIDEISSQENSLKLQFFEQVCQGNINYYNYFMNAYQNQIQQTNTNIQLNKIGLSIEDFNPRFNMRWKIAENYVKRGPKQYKYNYYFPKTCYGFGLNVSKYSFDEDWIKMDGNPNEWRILFHGTKQICIPSIIQNNLQPGGRQKFKVQVGEGIYFSNKIEVCRNYAPQVKVGESNFRIYFMSRCNPSVIKKLRINNIETLITRVIEGEFFIVNSSLDVRPYRILLEKE